MQLPHYGTQYPTTDLPFAIVRSLQLGYIYLGTVLVASEGLYEP